MAFITENLATIIIGVVLLAVIVLVTVWLIKNRSKYTCGCDSCNSCDSCASKESCRLEDPEK